MTTDLLQRNASGEIVTVWWNPITDVVSLTVHREMPDGCELVTADVPNVPRDRVLDAFHHPYAYAAHCGSITLPDRVSVYATTEDEYPEDGDDEHDDDQDDRYSGVDPLDTARRTKP